MNDLIDLASTLLDRQAAAAYDKPLPGLTDEPYAQRFWEAAGEERLLLQSCPSCDGVQYFPRPWCMECGDLDLDWIEADGSGTVQSYAVPRRTVANPPFADDLPYITAHVDLPEGVRVYTDLVNCDIDDVERGMPVEVVFDHVTDTVALPKFQPE